MRREPSADLQAATVLTAIQRLQALKGRNLLSGDSGLQSVWEEICVQMQGQASHFWDVYMSVLESVLAGHVATLNDSDQRALWMATDAGWDYLYDLQADDPASLEIPVDVIDIVDMLRTAVLKAADDFESPAISRYLYGEDAEDAADITDALQ